MTTPRAEAQVPSRNALRLTLGGVGALAGVGLFWLTEMDAGALDIRWRITLGAGILSGFGTTILLAGPAGLGRAVLRGALLAVLSLLLMGLAMTRQSLPPSQPMLVTDSAALAFAHLFGWTFLVAALPGGRRWRDYPRLFAASWDIAIRLTAGVIFSWFVFLILLLSDQVLKLVGVTVIDDLLSDPLFRWLFFGFAFGVIQAVLVELGETLSPIVVLKLLRLLVPVVLMVVVVFLIALPLRGLEQLFGGLSPAATLMSVGFAALCLITFALDRDNGSAVLPGPLRMATETLACLVLPIAVLADAAIWMRVAAYGWTPNRVLATVLALVMTVLALLYALAVLRSLFGLTKRVNWMARIRSANTGALVLSLALCVLWLTPVLDAAAVSARSQLARFEAGTLPPEEVPVGRMTSDWGRAGASALARIEAQSEEGSPVRIAIARQRETAAAALRPLTKPLDAAQTAMRLQAALTWHPTDAILHPSDLEAAGAGWLTRWLRGCEIAEAAGSACTATRLNWPDLTRDPVWLIVTATDPITADAHLFIPGDKDDKVRTLGVLKSGDGSNSGSDLGAGFLRAAQQEQARIAPSDIPVLHIGPWQLFPQFFNY